MCYKHYASSSHLETWRLTHLLNEWFPSFVTLFHSYWFYVWWELVNMSRSSCLRYIYHVQHSILFVSCLSFTWKQVNSQKWAGIKCVCVYHEQHSLLFISCLSWKQIHSQKWAGIKHVCTMILYVPSTIFQINRDWSSCVGPVLS